MVYVQPGTMVRSPPAITAALRSRRALILAGSSHQKARRPGEVLHCTSTGVRAAAVEKRFATNTGRRALIGSLDDVVSVSSGTSGTTIIADAVPRSVATGGVTRMG
jgi:hypothetical protein